MSLCPYSKILAAPLCRIRIYFWGFAAFSIFLRGTLKTYRPTPLGYAQNSSLVVQSSAAMSKLLLGPYVRKRAYVMNSGGKCMLRGRGLTGSCLMPDDQEPWHVTFDGMIDRRRTEKRRLLQSSICRLCMSTTIFFIASKSLSSVFLNFPSFLSSDFVSCAFHLQPPHSVRMCHVWSPCYMTSLNDGMTSLDDVDDICDWQRMAKYLSGSCSIYSRWDSRK